MGTLALAAKVSHVPSIWLSEQPGPFQGVRDFAIASLREIARRVKEREIDTCIVLDSHWQVTIGFHLNANARHEGRYTSHELPHFIADMPYAYDGAQELAQRLRDMAQAEGFKCRAHDMPELGLEYATLVPMRHINPDGAMRVLPVAMNVNASIDESRRFGALIRKAVEAGDGRVALLASGSLSHEMWPNDKAEAGLNAVNGMFNRQVDERVLELWTEGRIPEFLEMLPDYAKRCYGEAGMADTAMLFGALGWESYAGRGELIGRYFGSSGTGQCFVDFPVT